ncbi:glutamyl-tRNA reductase [Brachybacterium hainanense]|uniref:Glutamyl-tRNA reductase n=1 Tax=Brachybacterium hainanense TaxID=1541174 RepID=A0ABV6RF67_9MICO
MLVAVRATHEHLDLGVLDALTRDAARIPQVIQEVLAERGAQDALAAQAEGRRPAPPALEGWVVLGTCNRLEAYLDAHRFHDGVDVVVEAVSRTSGLDRDLVSLCFETATEAPVTRHLFEVTSGLRSLVIGEAEIGGQVRGDFEAAREAGHVTTMLHDLFQLAFRYAKRVATEAPVGAAGRSGVAVALDRAAEELEGLEGRRVLVVGTGAYARLGVAELARRGVVDVSVHSGSGRAVAFARRHGVDVVPPGTLAAALRDADLVLACSGRGTSLFPEQLLEAGPTLILDLALHSDLHPLLRHLQDVRVMGLADLASQLEDTAEPALLTAQEIIAEGTAEFRSRQQVRRVDPAMAAMRRSVGESADAEIARLRRETSEDVADQVERSIRRILAKVMHSPAARARRLAEDGHADEYVDAFHTIFGIDISAQREGTDESAGEAAAQLEEGAAAGWMRLDRTVPPRLRPGAAGGLHALIGAPALGAQELAGQGIRGHALAGRGSGCPIDHGAATASSRPRTDHPLGAPS